MKPPRSFTPSSQRNAFAPSKPPYSRGSFSARDDERTQKEGSPQETRNREGGFRDAINYEKRPKDISRFAPKPKKPRPQTPADCDGLYGFHAVFEALKNPARRHRRLLATINGAKRLEEEWTAEQSEKGDDSLPFPIAPEIVAPEVITPYLTPDAVHQGMYLESECLRFVDLEKLPQDKIILALDQVTDPHNVGAILRSAAAFAVGGVIVTHRHSPDISGVLAKAASGALEHVSLCAVTNLGRALATLKTQGFSVVGLDSVAPEELLSLKLNQPVVLVLGAEGRGLRPSIRDLCDHFARLDLPGAIHSLNVSNAAAISLYALHHILSHQKGE